MSARLSRGLAMALAAMSVGSCQGKREEPLNVILISVDTLRADRLGSYGSEAGITPNLDRFSEESVRFGAASAPSPWTTPSQMTMLTSLLPTSHGVNEGFRELSRFTEGRGTYRTLPESVPTLAELMKQAGYETAAMTGGSTMDASLGFGRGFDTYRHDAKKLTTQVWEALESWLEVRVDSKAPFFLFFHTFEVHAPYTRTRYAEELLSEEELDGMHNLVADEPDLTERELRDWLEERGLLHVEVTSRLYDGGVHHADAFFGRLRGLLQRTGLDASTLVLFTSDHGEEFADHRPAKIYNVHCDSLYQELLSVPLLIHHPRAAVRGAVVHEPVSTLDIAPTLLELVGVPAPPSMQGRSLAGYVLGVPGQDAEAVDAFSEATCVGPELKSVRSRELKYIVAVETNRERSGMTGKIMWERLFDLDADPEEKRDISMERPLEVDRLRSTLVDHLNGLPRADGSEVVLSDELQEQLKSLGYVQ